MRRPRPACSAPPPVCTAHVPTSRATKRRESALPLAEPRTAPAPRLRRIEQRLGVEHPEVAQLRAGRGRPPPLILVEAHPRDPAVVLVLDRAHMTRLGPRRAPHPRRRL